eukprot:TRINITY_DN21958_c1_g2_i1.p1 TRINITY_DN21958_c1_g2~~TRINITY_DN21958_c1_g2_i1.p1  ORF type:complete len:419 (-),score=87.53 TRINITY_DN21958_c1_g2_i1:39-1295(-)
MEPVTTALNSWALQMQPRVQHGVAFVGVPSQMLRKVDGSRAASLPVAEHAPGRSAGFSTSFTTAAVGLSAIGAVVAARAFGHRRQAKTSGSRLNTLQRCRQLQLVQRSATLQEHVDIQPGLRMPSMAYGAGTMWFQPSEEQKAELKKSVKDALKAGYRHLDNAEVYQNDAIVGEAVREWLAETGHSRSDLFITNKPISCDAPGVVDVCKRSLEATGLEYYDLYLVHIPFNPATGEPFEKSLPEIWKDMESLVDQGLVKAIGVSNWRVQDLEKIYDAARIKPVCNQVEAHPYLQQPKLTAWCQERNILVQSYGPLVPLKPADADNKDLAGCAGGPVDEVVAKAAARVGKTPAQVLLRWALDTGRAAVTTTSKPDRMKDSLQIFDFQLSQEEVSAISEAGASRPKRIFWQHVEQLFEETA